MSIEAWGDQEKKKKERTEEEQKEEIRKKLAEKKDKEILLAKIEKDKQLGFLKTMIEQGMIKMEVAEDIMEGESLDTTEIAEIFEKIDEIEQIHNIDQILPRSIRISKEEYIKALENDADRASTLAKIDQSLIFIHDTLYPNSFSILDFFSGFMSILNKNLVTVQENTIDIKRSLQNINNI